MFSGIIEGVGIVRAVNQRNDAVQLEIQAQFSLQGANVGDSIAVNGCCLTITSRLGNTLWSDVSEETLRLTTIGRFQSGDTVNLEQALQYGGRVGGHLVQGHVDGVGRIMKRAEQSGSIEFVIDVPLPLTRYLIEKGSIAVDGVSLTIAKCRGTEITVVVIPHTECKTSFHGLKANDIVNLEVDMVGKYIEKLAFLPSEKYHADEFVRSAFRKKFGFV